MPSSAQASSRVAIRFPSISTSAPNPRTAWSSSPTAPPASTSSFSSWTATCGLSTARPADAPSSATRPTTYSCVTAPGGRWSSPRGAPTWRRGSRAVRWRRSATPERRWSSSSRPSSISAGSSQARRRQSLSAQRTSKWYKTVSMAYSPFLGTLRYFCGF